MIRRVLTFSLIFVAAVVIFTFYNYGRAQERLRQSRPTSLTLSLGSVPSDTTAKTPVNFQWEVAGPPDFYATTTGIYYGYDSTSSAVTKYDSPQALRYPNYTTDYVSGRFRLPEFFDANITPPKAGTIFYRAYALVGVDHLWSEEKQLIVK